MIPKRAASSQGRNEACACGSGRKYKHCCGQTGAHDPGVAEGLMSKVRSLLSQGRREWAMDLLRERHDRFPADAETGTLLAEELVEQGQAGDALVVIQRVLAAHPDHVRAQCVHGAAAVALGRVAEGLVSLERAARLAPRNAAIHNNLGNALQQSGRCFEAVASFRRALALDGGLPAVHGNLGGALLAIGRADEALPCYAAGLARHGAAPDSYSDLLLAMQYADSVQPEQLASAHLRFGDLVEAPWRGRRPVSPCLGDSQRPLRVGWVSSDMRQHSVAFFLEPLLTNLDRRRFTLLAYHNHPGGDGITDRLRSHFAAWRNIHGLDDAKAEALIRDDAVDILFDLNGHTAGNRLPLFARRLAPVQVTWLGYPGTTGLQAMDWRISDIVADPPGQTDSWHSEGLWRLDHGFLCYLPPDDAPEPAPRTAGAPLVFGSMNNHVKLSPTALRLWSRLLREVPDARLQVKLRHNYDVATAEQYLAQLQALGVDRERVDVIGRLAGAGDHLQRYAAIDIALDSFPYHGTTTTCDALWMGVPVVTLAGRHHAARVGASLLHAVGLTDLVAHDEEGFVEIAAALARDHERLHALRVGLRQQLAVSPLLDAPAFGRRFGEALRSIWLDACGSAAAGA